MECGSSAPAFAIYTARNMTSTVANPLALIAELTHRCPLHCVYCSNPLELTQRSTELSTDNWSRVFQEAAALGVLQADFTGGEPLTRPDILDLIRAARAAGLYVNLITSGLPLDEWRLPLSCSRTRSLSIELSRRARRNRPTKSLAQKPTPKNFASSNGSNTIASLSRSISSFTAETSSNSPKCWLSPKPPAPPRRVRPRAILRLGFRQPRLPAPHTRQLTQSIDFIKKVARAPGRKNQSGICGPRLLREISETLHGWLGPQTYAHHAERRRASLPCRARLFLACRSIM